LIEANKLPLSQTAMMLTRDHTNTIKYALRGVVNKLQQQAIATWDSRTLLTTPNGHATDTFEF